MLATLAQFPLGPGRECSCGRGAGSSRVHGTLSGTYDGGRVVGCWSWYRVRGVGISRKKKLFRRELGQNSYLF